MTQKAGFPCFRCKNIPGRLQAVVSDGSPRTAHFRRQSNNAATHIQKVGTGTEGLGMGPSLALQRPAGCLHCPHPQGCLPLRHAHSPLQVFRGHQVRQWYSEEMEWAEAVERKEVRLCGFWPHFRAILMREQFPFLFRNFPNQRGWLLLSV